MFITFEGIDGCGKTSQIVMLSEYLSNLGYPIFLTKEPSQTPIGQFVRNLICNVGTHDVQTLFLVMAARHEHVSLINKEIESSKFVLCDRFVDSTIAYYSRYTKDLDIAYDTVMNMQRVAADDLMPNMTFLIKIDPLIAQQRMINRGDNDLLDSMPIEDLQVISDAFDKLSKRFTNRYMIINGDQDIEKVHLDVVSVMNRYLMI